jgi:hypothetical protein
LDSYPSNHSLAFFCCCYTKPEVLQNGDRDGIYQLIFNEYEEFMAYRVKITG